MILFCNPFVVQSFSRKLNSLEEKSVSFQVDERILPSTGSCKRFKSDTHTKTNN